MSGTPGRRQEMHFKLIGFEDFGLTSAPHFGDEYVVSVADISPMEDGSVEVTLQYEEEL